MALLARPLISSRSAGISRVWGGSRARIMHRINLNLAGRNAPRRPSMKRDRWVSIGVAAILLELGAFAIHYFDTSRRLRASDDLNKELEAQIAPLQNEPGELRRLEEQVKQAESEIASLQALVKLRSSGPLKRLVELSKILSPGWQPGEAASSTAAFTPGWNSDNAWLSLYEERGPTIRIEGRSLAASDAQQFMDRLDLSSEFALPEPLKGTKEDNGWSFALQVRVEP